MAAENLRVSIAPDIHPEFLAGWHIFLRHLQKQVEVSMDISSYANFGELRAGLEQGQVDMIFASAADCSYLVLQKNFVALARPESDVTEIVVLCRADAAYQNIEDIEGKQNRIAYADSPEVKHLGLILLEAANVGDGDLVLVSSQSHLLAAKQLMNAEVDLAFVPTDIYEGWSATLRNSMRPLVQTRKEDVEGLSHVLLLSSHYQHLVSPLKSALHHINGSGQQGLLHDINIHKWHVLDDNTDIDYLIDLVDTLQI